MSQGGARGPASPPKPPQAIPPSPASPPVAPKAVAAPKVPPAPPAPPRVGKTTKLGIQPPRAPQLPALGSAADDLENSPTRVEPRAAEFYAPAPAPAASPAPAAAVHAPAPEPSPAPARTAAPTAAVTPVAPAAAPALGVAEVRLIVRAVVEDAVLPLQRAIVESQQRIAELERRSSGASPPTVVLSATGSPAPAGGSPHAIAVAAPARAVVTAYRSVAPAPLLDVQAIERDTSIAIDSPFDGRRRRRRAALFLAFGLIVLFAGLLYLLVQSYTPHP